MTRLQLLQYLELSDVVQHAAAFDEFVSEMVGAQYGAGPTRQAWYFFKRGFAVATLHRAIADSVGPIV